MAVLYVSVLRAVHYVFFSGPVDCRAKYELDTCAHEGTLRGSAFCTIFGVHTYNTVFSFLYC